MASQVFFARVNETTPREERIASFNRLLDAVDYWTAVKHDDLVGIKTHFGETLEGDYVPHWYFPAIRERVESRGAHAFLCETSVLYKSNRDNAVQHLHTARQHGFGYDNTGMPIVMLDGLVGNNEREIAIDGELYKSVKLAADVGNLSHLVVVSHVTGHIMAGMGACLKNMGMGLASRKGKLQQHSGSKLSVDSEKCVACGVCVEHCPVDAISLTGPGATAFIEKELCIGCGECLAVCRFGAVSIPWDASSGMLQKRMAEHALGAYLLAGKNMVFVNFLLGVSKECDCMGQSDKLFPDIGILASLDPVAIDMASLDLVKQNTGKTLESMSYPDYDATIQVKHAEKLGLGSAEYEVVEV